MASPRDATNPNPERVSQLMARLRAVFIIAGFLGVTVLGMPVQWLLLKLHARAARTFPHRYHRLVAALFGMHIHVIGKPVVGEGVLMVANHTSWADIVIFSAVTPLSFVAKTEVGSWPLFGTLARLQRTVFVERQRRSTTGESRDEIRDRLLDGDTLLLFPEGTSHDGNRVLPFKSALLGAAEARLASGEHVKVQPVSVAFTGLHGLPMGRENRPSFAWYGDMEMVPHLWEAMLAGPLDVVVQFHEPLSLDRMDRKTLAARARQIVQSGQALALAGRA
jgi:1-acyl-sn-glycerol-3-phosphate acyltransferase